MFYRTVVSHVDTNDHSNDSTESAKMDLQVMSAISHDRMYKQSRP